MRLSLDQINLPQEAIGYFTACLALRPDDASACAMRVACYFRVGQVDHALADAQQWIRLHPDDYKVRNNTAWGLATSPSPKFRDAGRAVQLAGRAVELAPKRGASWNTLGVALYRTGDWRGAIKALMKAEELAPGEFLGINGFFLAMAHWQITEKEKARKWFDQAVEWIEKNQPQDEELRRFRAEAEELLGMKAQPK
jgi:Flp pilus assembly protein TadD